MVHHEGCRICCRLVYKYTRGPRRKRGAAGCSRGARLARRTLLLCSNMKYLLFSRSKLVIDLVCFWNNAGVQYGMAVLPHRLPMLTPMGLSTCTGERWIVRQQEIEEVARCIACPHQGSFPFGYSHTLRVRHDECSSSLGVSYTHAERAAVGDGW